MQVVVICFAVQIYALAARAYKGCGRALGCSRRFLSRFPQGLRKIDQPSGRGSSNFFHWDTTKQADHFRWSLLMSASLLSRTGVYQRFSLNGIRKIIELSTSKYARFPRYSSLSKLNAAENSFFKLSKSIEASFDANSWP